MAGALTQELKKGTQNMSLFIILTFLLVSEGDHFQNGFHVHTKCFFKNSSTGLDVLRNKNRLCSAAFGQVSWTLRARVLTFTRVRREKTIHQFVLFVCVCFCGSALDAADMGGASL